MTSSASLRVYGLHFATIAAPPLLSPLHHRGRVITLALPRCTNIRASPFCSSAEPKQQQQQQQDKPKVVVISGPTGAGKSRLGLEIAKRLNGEIISADSVQVYRGLDIGSAKPSPSDRREVPHHLLDILHPSEEYSAGRFYDDARRATEDVVARGRVPVVVGGTGMYLRWYVYGKPAVPVSSEQGAAEAEAELEGFRRSGRWDEAVELVVRAGDPRARSLAEGDWLRLRRSLEIVRSSGLPPSAFAVPYEAFKEEGKHDQEGNPPGDNDCHQQQQQRELDYDFHCFFLSSPRLDLYRSIDLRCEEMLMHNPGLLTESSWLLDSGLLPNTHSATRAIGYRQAMEYLLHCRETSGQCSPADFMHFLFDFQKASRNFAKRQMTWFRNERIYHWLDASRPMDRLLGFITDVCTGRLGDDGEGNGVVVVPNGLRMRKDLDGRGAEAKVLKSYRPRNRVFVNHDDCSPVLDWIRKTQSPRVLV